MRALLYITRQIQHIKKSIDEPTIFAMLKRYVRDTLIKAAEEYVKTRKRPNQDDFTKLMIDHFKKQRF